jgi:hypothetical protein
MIAQELMKRAPRLRSFESTQQRYAIPHRSINR